MSGFQNCKIVQRGVDPSLYHAAASEIKRGDPAFPISPSTLKIFAHCAKRWVDGYSPKETKARAFGSLLDCLLLTPDQFKKRYVVIPDNAPRKPSSAQRRAKKPSADTLMAIQWWDDFEADHKGKIVLDKEDHVEASAAVLKLQADPTVKAFVEASEKQVWVAGEWHDEQTGLVVPVRCLIDLEPRADSEFGKCLGDLKSTRSAALRAFLWDSFRMGHHIQAAFDLDLYRAATGEDRNTWCLLIQENYPPWTVGRRMISDFDDPTQPDSLMELGRWTYKRLISNYCQCLKSGTWPDFDMHENSVQGWTPLRAEMWMAEQATSIEALAPTEEGEEEPEPSEVTP